MIETILKEYNGVYKGITRAFCDICGKGVRWGPTRAGEVPKGSHVKSMLRIEGWIFGKVHKCSNCNY